MSVELSLAEAFADVHPAGAARVVEQANEVVAAEVLAALDANIAARVLGDMAPIAAARALEALPEQHAAEITRALPLDLAAALLRRVPAEERPRLVAAAGDDRRGKALAELLHHPPDTAGALMDPLVLAVPSSITAGEALGRVRRAPETAMYYLYVIGEDNRLVGVVNQRELMLASPVEPLTSLMRPRPDSLYAHATREAIAAHPGWQRVHALPVVDKGDHFLGAIRYETIRRIESELGQSARIADPRVTAEALGELYGLGLAGLAELASSAVRGPGARRGGES